MTNERVNNAGFSGNAIKSVAAQIGHINAPERIAADKPSSTPDFAEMPKGPAIPSDKNHLAKPESAQEEAMRQRAVNLNLEFRDDDFDSVSFALADNDQTSILTDRNPFAETHDIVESLFRDLDTIFNDKQVSTAEYKT